MKPLVLFAGSTCGRIPRRLAFIAMAGILVMLSSLCCALLESGCLAADEYDSKSVRRSDPAVGKRVALVIGNKDYKDMPLRNPVNDAEDLSQVLKRLGFSVILRTNVNRRQLEEAVDEFARQISRVEVALFYFSGHGAEAQGENYLVPVGDSFKSEADLRYNAVNAGMVLDKMDQARAGVNIVILDACRDNPFKGTRSASRGLSALQAARGSFVAYATGPGKVAADGKDRNSVYTKHLVRIIETKGLDILQAFQRVAKEVDRETNSSQVPWFSSALMGGFSFNPMVASVAPQPTPRPQAAQPRASEPPPGFSEEAGRLWTLAWKGDADAQNKLGILYEKGSGVPRDDAKAVEWYRKAADQGNSWAQSNLGVMYEFGRGVNKDYDEAVTWYRKAAEQGNPSALGNLGLMYEKGLGVAKDYSEAVEWYRKAAEQGNASAQGFLGEMYENGKGVAKDYVEALKWYRKAVEQRNAYSEYRLGVMYENGYGVTKDYEEAVKWYRKAADQGNASAQGFLGEMYENGKGVAKDYAEALNWYRRGAEKGNAYSEYRLGMMYEYGYGIAKDYGEALKWYRKAAEQGQSYSQNRLGRMYQYGYGVSKDYGEAMKWYKKAADQGDSEGQKNVGLIYEDGLGVAKDNEEAVRW